MNAGRNRWLAWAAAICSVALSFERARCDDSLESPSIEIEFPAEPEIAKRTVEFDESNESLELTLFAADPKLLEQKFVATLAFVAPQTTRTSRVSVGGSGALMLFARFDNRFRYAAQGASEEMFLEPAILLKILAKNLPDLPDRKLNELKPATEEWGRRQVQLPLQHRRHGGRGGGAFGGGGPRSTIEFEVYGETREVVKSRSMVILGLYDYGLSYPLQAEQISEMTASKAELPKLLAAFHAQQADADQLKKQLAEYDAISDDSIMELRNQQRLLLVDIAGTRARIAACSKFLERPKSRSTAEQVESLRITAEIELVGHTARESALGAIIERGTERRKLVAQFASKSGAVTSASRQIGVVLKSIRERDSLRQTMMPLAVVDNVIPIRPIKWKSAE